jgi:hypothetical protein
MIGEFSSERLTRDKVKYYAKMQGEWVGRLGEVYRVLLRRDSQKAFLEWHYGLLLGNLKRTKLSARLQNADNQGLSH